MRIVLFKGQSQYEVLNTFIDDVAKAFSSLCGETHIIDLLKHGTYDLLKKEIPEDTDIIFSFNGLGPYIAQDFNKEIVYITSYVDHPMYLLDRIVPTIPKQLMYFVDSSYVDLLRHNTPDLNPRLLFQAGCYNTSEFSIKNKKIDVLFCGSYTTLKDHEDVMEEYPNKLKRYIKALSDEIIRRPTIPLNTLANEISRKQACFMNHETYITASMLADKHSRGLKRKNLLTALLQNGITVHCFGNGWEKSGLSEFNNFILKPPVDFREMLNIMNQSKIVLCSLPNLPNGVHDRIFSTMQMYSVSATDISTALKEMFLDMKDIVFYTNTQNGYQELIDKIKTLLSNDSLLEEITMTGNYIAMKNHTWENRVNTVIKDLKESNLCGKLL